MLNLDHMHWFGFLLRFLPVGIYVTFDVYETYQRYVNQSLGQVSYAAHLGGAFVGLTFGFLTLKNFKRKPWEDCVWKICIIGN